MSRDPADLLKRLKSRGITHLLSNDNYIKKQTGRQPQQSWTPEDQDKARRFRSACMKPLYQGDNSVWVDQVAENL